MSDNQISLASSAKPSSLDKESILNALALSKVSKWVSTYYDGGHKIPFCAYPLSQNCLVALYMTDTFKDLLPPGCWIEQSRFRTFVRSDSLTSIVEVVTPIEILYLIRIYDDNMTVVGKDGFYEWKDVLDLIHRAMVAYDADYNPVHLKAMCDADKG